MKLYKCYYEKEEKKVKYIEFDSPDEYSFDNDPETNLYDCQDTHNTSINSTKAWCDRCNQDIAEGLLKVRRCKECGIYFFIENEEVIWFTNKGYSLPKRCMACRIKNRNNRDKKEEE